MEHDAVIDGTYHLDQLRAELAGRGWAAEIRNAGGQAVLLVCNSAETGLRGQIVCRDEDFHWEWGGAVGPVTAVLEAADRIVFVLGEITSDR